MRNRRKTVKILPLFSVWVLFLGLGCATPKHTNTLIFGTNTKFALDVSVDPTGSPSVTVGYRRQEMVWMPLLANKDVEGTPAECEKDSCLFIGTQEKDTYSVLASFGAKFSGATAGGPKATGGLAQYFATGWAARKLAEKGGARIVSVQPEDTTSKEIKKAAAKLYLQAIDKTEAIVNCVTKNRDNLNKILKKAGMEDEEIEEFKQSVKKEGLRKVLSPEGYYFNDLNRLYEASKAICK